MKNNQSRRSVLGGFISLCLGGLHNAAWAQMTLTPAAKFKLLSTKGNSNCSAAFLDSIPNMDSSAHLQGSCCSPMELTRYKNQIAGLVKYNTIADIPPDPYDIEAGLAKKLLGAFDDELTATQQKEYD